MTVTILQGDCLEVLKTLPAQSVNCIVTSPPYYGLRDYGTGLWVGGDQSCSHKPCDTQNKRGIDKSTLGGGTKSTGHKLEGFRDICQICGAVRIDNQIGLESTPDEYVSKLVSVFRECRRVLRDDGTMWVNIGDSYSGGGRGGNGDAITGRGKNASKLSHYSPIPPKNLILIPFRLAIALQADGWIVRQDIIWNKPNPMPESVTDRCTKSHEYIFLLSKQGRYYFDQEAIQETAKHSTEERLSRVKEGQKSNPDAQRNGIRQRKPAGWDTRQVAHGAFHRDGRAQDIEYTTSHAITRNKRSVWTVTTQPYSEAHFATYPPKLIEPCILAGCPAGGTVLDPFNGAGTTGLVSIRNNRNYIGIELNPEYIKLTEKRLKFVQPKLEML